jgi:hypothetical protein
MANSESFEDYINHMINEGFIAEDGTPLKCHHCEGKEFTEYEHDYLDHCYGVGVGLLEYKLKCNNCDKNVGYWVAGHWEV